MVSTRVTQDQSRAKGRIKNWNWRPDTRVQMCPSIPPNSVTDPLVHRASRVWLHLPVKTTVSHLQQETRNIRLHFQNKGTKSTTVGSCMFRKSIMFLPEATRSGEVCTRHFFLATFAVVHLENFSHFNWETPTSDVDWNAA